MLKVMPGTMSPQGKIRQDVRTPVSLPFRIEHDVSEAVLPSSIGMTAMPNSAFYRGFLACTICALKAP
jgi:hypothetical protein